MLMDIFQNLFNGQQKPDVPNNMQWLQQFNQANPTTPVAPLTNQQWLSQMQGIDGQQPQQQPNARQAMLAQYLASQQQPQNQQAQAMPHPQLPMNVGMPRQQQPFSYFAVTPQPMQPRRSYL